MEREKDTNSHLPTGTLSDGIALKGGQTAEAGGAAGGEAGG
jgi:hypothetical protein